MRCRPVQPMCSTCPLAGECAWHLHGGDDPAVGSARVSKPQSPFQGSDRQARGKVLKVLAGGPAPSASVAEMMDCGEDRALRLVDDLVAEGLVVRRGGLLALP
jgi:A/G-specific adenine glycosylase